MKRSICSKTLCICILTGIALTIGQVSAQVLDPNSFASLGAFPASTVTYVIDTDLVTLKADGIPTSGVVFNGIAVFTFNSGPPSPHSLFISGIRPLALLFRGDANLDLSVVNFFPSNGGTAATGGSGGNGEPGGGGGGGGGGTPGGAGGFGLANGSGASGGTGGAGGAVGANGGGGGGVRLGGGGGGGFGGAGGIGGGTDQFGDVGGAGGSVNGNLAILLHGGSGGGGGSSFDPSSGFGGGGGGGGGGAVEIGALGNLTVGSVSALGGDGGTVTGSGGGGGGGAGGGILLWGATVTSNGVLDAFGGDGGNAGSPGGGGGGGGRILILSASGNPIPVLFNVAGGHHGSFLGDNGNPGLVEFGRNPLGPAVPETGGAAIMFVGLALTIVWAQRTAKRRIIQQ